jgi:hypothetical protein
VGSIPTVHPSNTSNEGKDGCFFMGKWSFCRHGLRLYKCRLCCQERYYPNAKKRHKKCEHGLAVYKCDICRVRWKKEYYQKHKKENDRKHRQYYQQHKEEIKAKRMERYWRTHPIRTRKYVWKDLTPEEAKLLRSDFRLIRRLNKLFHYGYACELCGNSNLNELEIDHKYGYGRQHRKEIGVTAPGFYYWLQRNNYPSGYTVNGVYYPDGFRVLCKRCNNKQPRAGGRFATKKSGTWRAGLRGN